MTLNLNSVLKTSIFLGALIILQSIPVINAGATEVDFSSALELLLKGNERLEVARITEDRLALQRSAMRGLYYPKLTVSGRYTHLDDAVEMDLNDIRTAMLALHPDIPAEMLPSFDMTFQDEQFWRASADLVWPVFTGGRIQATNRAAELRVKGANENIRQTESELLSELVQGYFGLRLSKDLVHVAQEAFNGMSQHFTQAQALEKNGLIPHAETLHAKVALDEADRQLKMAIHNVDIAQTVLQRLLLCDDDLEPNSPLFILQNIEPLEVFEKSASEMSPLIRQVRIRKSLTQEAVKKEKSAYLPDLYLFGTKALYTEDLTTLEPEWAAGVGASFTLFDGFSRRHRLAASKKAERAAVVTDRQAILDVKAMVEKVYYEMLKAREKYDALYSSRQYASELLRTKQRAFEEGFATSLELVDAQLALSHVKVDELKSAYEFDVALSRLLQISGEWEWFENYRQQDVLEVSF